MKLPVIRKAARQPSVSVIAGTMRGVTIAPTLVPALKMPVANARSLLREPLGDGFQSGRKVARFPEPDGEARDHEARQRARPCVRHVRYRPDTTASAYPNRAPILSISLPKTTYPSA